MEYIYYKIKKFNSFIIFTEDVTSKEIDEFSKNNLTEVISPIPTNLGYNVNKKTYFIYEWQIYDLQAAETNPFADSDYFYRGKRNRLSNTATLRLENFVGTIQFRNQIFEVHSKKMSYEKVNNLVEYVDKKVAQLSFRFNSTAISKKRFVKENNIHDSFNKFTFLYHLLRTGKLFNAIRLVLQNPFQKTQNEVKLIDFSEAREFEPKSLIDIFSGQIPLKKSSRNLPIVKKLNDFIPDKINQRELVVSSDNNENQFVLFFLKQCIRILSMYIKRLEEHSDRERIVHGNFIIELKIYQAELTRMSKSRLFQEVSNITMINKSSTVLTKRPGYKELYNYYLNIKSVPINSVNENDFIELFENKSIDKLYEYIGLFYLDDYLKEVYDVDPRIEKLNINHKNYSVVLDEKNDKIKYQYSKEGYPTTTLYFQRSYSPRQKTSYAITQSPDFSLFIERNSQLFLYHFDTKFKMKVFDVDLSDEQTIHAKEEDLKSMHAYRDGIIGTIGAYVLYPGNYNSKTVIYKNQKDLNSEFNVNAGIGSVPLQIEDENQQLKKFINDLIKGHI